MADEWKVDVAARIDAHWFAGHFVEVGDRERNCVVGAKDVIGWDGLLPE